MFEVSVSTCRDIAPPQTRFRTELKKLHRVHLPRWEIVRACWEALGLWFPEKGFSTSLLPMPRNCCVFSRLHLRYSRFRPHQGFGPVLFYTDFLSTQPFFGPDLKGLCETARLRRSRTWCSGVSIKSLSLAQPTTPSHGTQDNSLLPSTAHDLIISFDQWLS